MPGRARNVAVVVSLKGYYLLLRREREGLILPSGCMNGRPEKLEDVAQRIVRQHFGTDLTVSRFEPLHEECCVSITYPNSVRSYWIILEAFGVEGFCAGPRVVPIEDSHRLSVLAGWTDVCYANGMIKSDWRAQPGINPFWCRVLRKLKLI